MLKSRRVFPPGMFRFHQPETGWRLAPGRSFEESVDAILKHRLANPRFAGKWSTDWNAIADELDKYTCDRIKNDPAHCRGVDDAKKSHGLPPSRQAAGQGGGVVAGAKKIVTGIGVLVDWLGSGAKPVEASLAEARAQVCVKCRLNGKGDLTSIFTVPASRMIQQQIEIKRDLKLSTSVDNELGVCDACLCPLKLKVHTPIGFIRSRMSQDQYSQLDRDCWMTKE